MSERNNFFSFEWFTLILNQILYLGIIDFGEQRIEKIK